MTINTSEAIIRPNYNAIKAHGVWDRSSYDKDSSLEDLRKEPFLKGLRISPRWKYLEPKRDEYDWSIIDKAVEKAAKKGKYFYFQLLVGPDSPDWIYDKDDEGNEDVPLVEISSEKKVNERKEDLKWPYYPDANYQEYLKTTITAIADHMYNDWSDEELDRLLFIQVATGSTGDEAPYKGQAVNKKYELDDQHPKWNDYRMTIFKAYAKEFQQPKRKKSIALLFNKIDEVDYPDEHLWANDNITYLGRKGSVLPRGYHLTEMAEFIDKFREYTVDPKERFILTRAEMDQTWRHPYFQLNLPLNMYWAVLNALHGGLCVWDVSKKILDPEENDRLDEIIPTFEFFNKYAGELFPESANRGFIAFHKGLDSADTETYPPEKFSGINEDGTENVNKGNKKRYKAICNEYEKFGAQMDHVKGATYGQVQQRKEKRGLEGFNDCGWKIPSGNYERFITQIEPDKYDVARWRIGGKLKKDSPIYSRFARGFHAKEDKNGIYLRVNDKFYQETTAVKVTLTYFDEGKGSFAMKYDSTEEPDKKAYTLTKKNTGKWRTKEVILKDAAFKKRGDKSSDISLVNMDDEDDIFHMVEIEKIN